MPGKSLRVYVTGNSPRSLKKITEFNWSGYAFYGTREQIKQISSRSESEATGVYFLFSDINSELVKMYVGETENFMQRIKNHQKKEWWTHFVVFQSEGSFLNKAHVRYLEHIFYKKAKNSTEIELMNETEPREPILAEQDVADLQFFEDNILYILEALNLIYFSNYRSLENSSDQKTEYICKVPHTDLNAQMVKIGESYILKAGSNLKRHARDSFKRSHGGYYKRWVELINSEHVEHIDEKSSVLKNDLEFSSASVAGAMVRAGATNGLTAWKNKITNKTIKEELVGLDREVSDIAA